MDEFYTSLHADGMITDDSLEKIKEHHQNPGLFSVYWELKTVLYAGVVLLVAGLGLLIYENIDTIGHQFVLLLIAVIGAGSFAYCFKTKPPFSPAKTASPNIAFDYLLLLACISLTIFVGYLQFEYKSFGTNYGLATLIPMLALFFCAYFFDHIGVLNMAIANLAICMGVSVTPKELLLNSDFNSETIIYTYLALGLLLLSGAFITQRSAIKPHFRFSYQHYGVHVTFIILLAGYFHYYDSVVAVLWMLGLVLFAFLLYKESFKAKHFYFLLLVVLYSYVAIICLITRLLIRADDTGGIALLLLFYIASGVGLIFLLIDLNKKLKKA